MFCRPTQSGKKMVADGRTGYLALQGMLPIESSVPLKQNNEIVGAIGTSGVMSFRDGQIAPAGATNLSYKLVNNFLASTKAGTIIHCQMIVPAFEN